MLSAADVISNVIPGAVGINVTVGLKVRTLSFTLAPFDKVSRGTLRRFIILFLIACSLGSAANALASCYSLRRSVSRFIHEIIALDSRSH